MSAVSSSRSHLVERAMGLVENAPPPPRPTFSEAAPAPTHPVLAPRPVIDMATLVAAGLVDVPSHGRRSRVLEELALVRHQIMRNVDSGQGDPVRARIVLIASALPHEGKSFIALNLAAGMATAGARQVILVDADGRDGSVSDSMGAGPAPGIRNLVADPSLSTAGILLPTAIERLSFVSHGGGPSSGAETPSGSTMASAIRRLAASRPDHVLVLDPPPCLSTSDCSALAEVAGQVVLIVDAERTRRNEVEAALDVLEACPVLQLLLNRVRLTVNDTFGARGEYGTSEG